jgi:predicted RNA-binding protein with PIN domain
MTAPRRRLVDGMNVIGARPTGWWRDRTKAMRDLAAALSAFAAATGERVTLVLDGRERDIGEHPGVEVVWAPAPGPNAADRVLGDIAEQAEDRDVLVAVTSDRALAERLGSLGVEVEGAGAFRRHLDELTEP